MNKFVYILSLFVLFPAIGYTAPLNLSNSPLYLGGSAEPNIMFILDDSGSMMFEITPDELAFLINSPQSITGLVYPRANSVYGSDYDQSFVQVATVDDNNAYNARTRSPQFNASYYNPSVTYVPWTRDDNSLFPNASITCAWHNPLNTGSCPTGYVNNNARNLTTTNSNYNSNRWRTCNSSGNCSSTTNTKNFWPATYFWHNSGDGWSWNHYTKIEIRSSITSYTGHGRINRSECNNGTCTYDQEIQNFANWYTYYRSRVLSSRAGIGKAFAAQSESKRIGYGAINKASSDVDGEVTSTIVRGIRPFEGDDREGFFNELYGRDIPASGTPLRKALDDAGQYYSRDGDESPWSTTPGESGGEDLQCRQSYSILMTDGYWSGTSTFQASTAGARANVDGTNGPTITGPNAQTYQYVAKSPFYDNRGNTLADVAMYYWNRDLRPDLANKVPKTPRNEAFWQHMVTYGVSFGVSGSIEKDEAWAAVAASKTGTPINITWPDPDAGSSNCNGDACAARLDDLLHASINSRGDLFSADDPKTFAESISAILANISDETSSASSVALNSGSISSDSKVFQARFNSGDWTGQLLAFPIIDDSEDASFGELSSPPAWDARNLIPAANDRNIITFDGSLGRPFRWDNISAEQKLLLNNEPTLDYLRGIRTGEQSNPSGTFRNRNFLLGDIINSAPAFVGAPIQRYPDSWGAGAAESTVPYSSFKATNSNRQPLVYVGANDGMLHAFNADTGAELFAYVPASIYPNLPSLANPNYTHKYFVDGSPTVVDAFIEGEWRTILVSGLGGGGQGIFALDVTNPGDFSSEEDAANRVLWEFTDEYVSGDKNGKDLGFTYGQPSIVRLQNGDWAAIFSGGYNNTVDNNADGDFATDSTTGDAVLFIVRLSDGVLIETIEIDVAVDPTGQNRPNGLASPAAVDIDGDFVVDYVYAGDLFGNMWKFDLTSSSPSNWGIAYESEGIPKALFQACYIESSDLPVASDYVCPANNIQPITTRPQVVRHPTSNGLLVLFGTGKYLEVNDNSAEDQTTQTFYAIWDKRQDPDEDFNSFNRSELLQQLITHEGTRSEIDGRDLEDIQTDSTDYRVTSDNSINWSDDLGWYVDLKSPNTVNNFGERQVSNSVVRNGRIIFTTLLPSTDPCDSGGTGWLMELNYATGARLSYSPFDITGEGIFNEEDFICIENCDDDDPSNDVLVPTSGKKSDVGIIPTPSIASEAGGQREFKYTSGSSGNIEVTVENPGPGFEGRQSWRQLDFQFR